MSTTNNGQPEARELKKGSLAAFRGLLPFLKPYRNRFAIAGIALVVAAASTLAIPYAFKQMIDLGFGANAGVRSAAHVNEVFLALFAVATVLALATAARFYSVSWLGERVTADIRNAVYSHVVQQSPEFFETTKTGEVLSRLTTDTTLIQSVVGTSISMALRNVLLFLGGLVMLFVTSPKLSSIIIGLLVLTVLPIVIFGRRVRKLSRDSQDRVADASAMAGEILNAMPTVQAFTHENLEAKRFGGSVEGAFSTAMRRIQARAFLTMLAIVLVFGTIVFVLWLGAHAVLEGTMTGGDLGQFILYASIVAGAIGALSEVMGEAQRAAGATERLLELLAVRSDIQNPAQPQALPPRAANGAALSLAEVSFCYPSRPDTLALDHVTLDIKPGETIAVVGPSGAGKTTLFQMLLRFYDPQSGAIRLDGTDIRQLDPTDLRQSIGCVLQDPHLFFGSVKDNITLGAPYVDEESFIRAATLAGVDQFVRQHPLGYDMPTGENGRYLSGGQRQSVAVARALLLNPPILVLDEPTSSMDNSTENTFKTRLGEIVPGKTLLLVTHRNSMLSLVDRLIVLDRGKVVADGPKAGVLDALMKGRIRANEG